MMKISAFATGFLGLALSLPASAVVSLHGSAPHATTMLIGFGRTGILATVLGVGVVAAALFVRYRKAR